MIFPLSLVPALDSCVAQLAGITFFYLRLISFISDLLSILSQVIVKGKPWESFLWDSTGVTVSGVFYPVVRSPTTHPLPARCPGSLQMVDRSISMWESVSVRGDG